MKTETFEYEVSGTTYEGFVAVPEGAGPFPGVLVSHAWAGRDAFADEKAKELAQLGYVAFAHDLYGKGKRGSSTEENSALMTPFVQDRAMLRQRMAGAIELLRSRDEVSDEVAAIGFCFGGLCVLDLIRAGVELSGVVSFHGLLMPAEGIENKARAGARALVLHGFDDPMVPPDAMVAFAKEMTEAKVDWQLHAYGHTKHAFTVPDANDHDLGTVYAAPAAKRSWQAMQGFLRECFG